LLAANTSGLVFIVASTASSKVVADNETEPIYKAMAIISFVDFINFIIIP
jgi:hypothetical protein